ncbi:MAG: hypothetical protein E7288_00485 [Lachnospiraceae bacterium]|nr:hypothetical protein [Lachnospiraceae bacterium]
MEQKENSFVSAITGKKLPILTLDHKWHQLFTQVNVTPEIKAGEEKLNTLLKRQGKINTETKEIKKIKSRLMDEIVSMMDEQDSPATIKKSEENKRLIEECNEKLEAYSDEMLDLPREIDQANKELMLATMEICYRDIKSNAAELEEITQWINNMRVELKKNVVRKEEMQRRNNDLYVYMHDIFGADVIELFDMKFKKDEK